MAARIFAAQAMPQVQILGNELANAGARLPWKRQRSQESNSNGRTNLVFKQHVLVLKRLQALTAVNVLLQSVLLVLEHRRRSGKTTIKVNVQQVSIR